MGNLAFGMRRDMYGTDWKYLDDDSSVFAAGDAEEYGGKEVGAS